MTPTFNYGGINEDWRVGEDGRPPAAPLCRCSAPFLATDSRGDTSCVKCGRSPETRPSKAFSRPRRDSGCDLMDPFLLALAAVLVVDVVVLVYLLAARFLD